MNTKPKRKVPRAREPRSPDVPWLDSEEAGFYIGLSPKTLANMRVLGSGPKFHQSDTGIIRYLRAELDEWMGPPMSSTSAVASS